MAYLVSRQRERTRAMVTDLYGKTEYIVAMDEPS